MQRSKTDISSFVRPREVDLNETNSLLTFADMVLALDHTYAGVGDENIPKLLDAECLVQKEKDHTYAFSGRVARGRPSSHAQFVSDPGPTRRSSSEENISRSSVLTGDLNSQAWQSARKCHSFEKVSSNLGVKNADSSSNTGLSSSLPSNEFFSRPKSSGEPRKDHTYARAGCDKTTSVIMVQADKRKEGQWNPFDQRETGSVRPQQLIADHTYDRILPSTSVLSRISPSPWALPSVSCFEPPRSTDHTYFTSGRRDLTQGNSSRIILSQPWPLTDALSAGSGGSDHTYSTFA